MHPFIAFVVEQGVPQDTAVLLLMFPIIATLMAFFRQVIGIKAFGIYTPSIITFAFLAFGPKGVKYGVVIFLAMVLSGMVSRLVLRRFRLLYLPRVAIMLTFVSLAILAVLAVGGSLHRTGLAAVSIFPLLIMITLVEKFVAAQMEKGDRTAVLLALETLLLSLIGYAVAASSTLGNWLIHYPWLVLLTLPINFWLGKWTGLRFSEYLRFRKLLS